MKPLLEMRITRDNVANPVREWRPAETHETHEGRVEFRARMMARIAEAQQPSAPAIPIRKRRSA